MEPKRIYARNLPRIQPEDGVFSIVFRLDGSLPLNIIRQLQKERAQFQKETIQKSEKPQNSFLERKRSAYFKKFDSLPDNPKSGPVWLKNEKVANIVKNSIHFLNGSDFSLICYCIMSNHVHLVIYKIEKEFYKILQSLKRHTAREANIELKRSGTFWQKESYDHLIRSQNELENTIKYVLNNPVAAGLTNHWEKWKFTYCDPEFLP